MDEETRKKRRSQVWFGAPFGQSGSRGWMKNQGYPHDLFDGRPVIGICNTWSELTPCNQHMRQMAKHVHDGVLEAGGFPLEFPVTSLGETLMRPTTMLYRNLAAMDVEESIRANPLDGVVLMCGCDKTTPALVMGAASCDIPSIVISGGPMLNGWWRGQRMGNGTTFIKLREEIRAGAFDPSLGEELEASTARSIGHCNTMGTASSMASVVESLGLALPQNAAIPAADARRNALARMVGRRAVGLVEEDLTMSKILTKANFENVIMTIGAIGGSTNAVIHLLAIAGRMGIDLTLDDWDRLGRDMPCLVNLMPSGEYLMEDFFYAGGLPAVMSEIGHKLHLGAMTVTGKTVGENLEGAASGNRDVIHSFDQPFKPQGGIAVLRGNLCPDGAVLKPSAATPELMTHRGRAVVFEDIRDFRARIDDPDLDVDESCILVLKSCGPKGFPGMPETGNMGLPKKLLEKGVRDMVRISDARMSGTAFGTVVLHSAPESAVGGPLAAVENGDMIELDVPNRRLTLEVDEAEIARRLAERGTHDSAMASGWQRIYADHVLQADKGADLDVLVGSRGAEPPYK